MAKQKADSPKQYSVRVTLNALQNIDEITGYIAFVNQQPLNAITVGDALFNTIDKIQRAPLAYRECA